MDLFHIIDDGQVIVKQNGIFRQQKVYRRGGDVYAGVGTGFVKLMQRGNTSVPSISWIDLEAKGVDIHGAGLRAGSPIFTGKIGTQHKGKNL